jgi:synaptic vesicle membrane protein VAT-1
MQQIVIPEAGDPSVLIIQEKDDPAPGPGEVRIQVKASGVNFADAMARMGLYQEAPPFPSVVGYEVSGHVDAVGVGVDPALIGEPVLALTQFGGYASVVCVPEDQIMALSAHQDVVEAAAIPVTGLTAWMMLEELARVREGDRVLVHSAGGGVGLMALDLLKWRGAHAVGLASCSKHDLLLERGFDEVYDSRITDFREHFNGLDGFDLVLDPIGGKSWGYGLELLRPGGKLIGFGMSAMAPAGKRNLWSVLKSLAQVPWFRVNPIALIQENKGVLGMDMAKMWDESAQLKRGLSTLLALWNDGVLRPLVHERVPFSESFRAHEILHRRENIGKVLLIPDGA